MYKQQVTTIVSPEDFRCPCNLCAGAQSDKLPRVEPSALSEDQATELLPMRMPVRRIPRLAVAS